MTTELSVRGASGLSPRSMTEAEALATHAAKSGLCAVRDPSQALVVLMTGMELGLSPMQSFRGIHVVNGKPVLSADLLVGIVRASGICQSWQTLESTVERCTIETQRIGDATPTRKTWTMEDAKRARLSTQVWGSYPAQMLRHRCAADLAREVYPDLAMGLYTPDEVSDGRVSDADVGTVTLVRDDAPAQHAAPDALDAFRAALADATDLAGIVAVYQRADLGGTSAKPVTDAVIERAAVLGYYLNGVEAKALLGGTLDATLTTAYERLADVTRHADDEDGDGVVADIVRIVRDYRSEAKPITTRVWSAAAGTAAYHLRCDEESAKQRLTAALTPPPPPTAGAQASVADGGLIMGLDGWREYLAKLVAAQVPVFAIAGSFHKHRAAFADAGVLEQRRAETLAAIEAREGRGPEAARQALDGYATRRVMPVGVGAVIQMPSREQREAARTGTDG